MSHHGNQNNNASRGLACIPCHAGADCTGAGESSDGVGMPCGTYRSTAFRVQTTGYETTGIPSSASVSAPREALETPLICLSLCPCPQDNMSAGVLTAPHACTHVSEPAAMHAATCVQAGSQPHTPAVVHAAMPAQVCVLTCPGPPPADARCA